MENQALKFISIQANDEYCCRNYQYEYPENYVEDGSHVQGMTWNAPFCYACIPHRNKNIFISYTLFLGLQDGSSNTARSKNPISRGTDGIRTWGS